MEDRNILHTVEKKDD